MARSGKVYYKDHFAGIVEETDDGYCFTYASDYCVLPNACPLSVTLPLRPEPYRSGTLHPFFDGLIPEGWLLSVAVKNWKLDERDRMGLLLAVCRDCIGAVSVEVDNE